MALTWTNSALKSDTPGRARAGGLRVVTRVRIVLDEPEKTNE